LAIKCGPQDGRPARPMQGPIDAPRRRSTTAAVSGWTAPAGRAIIPGRRRPQRRAATRKALRTMQNAISLVGVLVLMFLAWLLSADRRRFPWRVAAWGLGLQFSLAVLLLRTPWGGAIFGAARDFITRLLGFTDAGASFLWGGLYRSSPELVANLGPEGGYWQVTNSVTGQLTSIGTVFIMHVLPTIIFFSSLMAVLYHLGVMQVLIAGIARLMQRTMGTSGSETLSCSANIFVGQTEAPFVIRPYLATMTNSEIMAVMVGGFATVAGGVLAMYAAVLQGIPGIAGHLVTASCMAAPGALVISKIVYPETEESVTMGDVKIEVERLDNNIIEAASRGASEGMSLLVNIVAMLIAFVALVAMADSFLVAVFGVPFTTILGWIFWPVAWLMGIPAHECTVVGKLLGEKIVLTELLAYLHLADIRSTLSQQSQIICSYALCGFANFASIGIQIGGIGGIAPSRRSDLAQLGVSAMFSGMLVTCITGTIAGIFLSLGY
jgi:concentrative nucleoside transporter, CNT family